MRKLSRVVAAALISTTLLSCGGGRDTTAPPTLATLSVSVLPATFAVGQSATATAQGLDQFGASISTGVVSWSTESSAIATVNANGVVVGVSPASTNVIATGGGKQAQALVTVILPPVAIVTVSPATAAVAIGATQQLTANTLDGSGNPLTGRQVTWTSSNESRATVSSTGLVTGVTAGPATITATSEGNAGTSQIIVGQSNCSTAAVLQLAVGEIHALTEAEKVSLCLGGSTSASEYVLIPFNSTSVAASTIQIQISGINTSAIQPGSLALLQPAAVNPFNLKKQSLTKSFEWAFRERERQDLASVFASTRRSSQGTLRGFATSNLTGIAPTPVVGSFVQINANLTGNTCTAPKQLHGAEVVAVLPHTIVLSDTLSPTGGYTNAELTSFGQAFETSGYDLDVLNFGAETDIDSNSRIAILFTPGVNVIPGPPGATVGGLFAARDLFPVGSNGCPASNEGEMFYVPVPDPNNTINAKYAVKADLARDNLGTLVHEFQHLINAGRRIYVNNASSFEEVWLNEGLSHIAEELLYYQESGNSPRSNIDLPRLRSTQAQLNAVNTYQINNLARLISYMQAPETNSPFSQTDGLQMRGAIWQLLRYSADRKGGAEQSTWSALVNTTSSGQLNFNAVFGDIITMSRDWAVAQFTDDAGLNVAANYTYQSWNFRSILPAINQNTFPLLTRPLLGAPVDITLNGGGAAYIRFLVGANVPATISASSSGQAVPAAVDFILVRTQ
ncbi:MAG TPA: Ig-like domain-containing protein [Gemmatimonadaceae bacterium]|nr:Ig-like domain-containing protein [Gemmatimonadaceae bacterium]